MQRKYPKARFFSTEAIIFVLITILSLIVLVHHVDMTPHVDQDFFFSSDDPNYQADAEISKLFIRKDSQIIISVAGDIFSESYQDKIRHLTKILSSFEQVNSVKSIVDGPRSPSAALKSPFWRRTLIADNRKSSNVIVILNDVSSEDLIPKIEHLITALHSKDFHIRVSGFPYIIELIRRNLLDDLNTFSLLALILFSTAAIMIFHSWRILLGMIVTCVNAGAYCFMINQLLGIKIGILTANLATIVSVLTLSHIVFLTFNWKHFYHPGSPHNQHTAVEKAIESTISASFWSMLTTLLGFISLLFVQAKPLRELGICGAIGTVMAFLVTYGIYPAFLRLKKLSPEWVEKQTNSFWHKTFRRFEKNHSIAVIGIALIILITSPGLWRLNTDPSLFSFFAKDSEIVNGLEYIDKNGGSSPLLLVLKDHRGRTLNTKRIFWRLWRLQESLENHPDVGTIISLPTLMAEGRRVHFSFLLSSEGLLERMEQDRYDRIASSFITSDRKLGLFFIRMKEEGRTLHRLEVVQQLKDIIRSHQFVPHLVGGIYALQGKFSQHIATSLIYGLGRLIFVFMIIAFITSLSIRIGLAMTLSISIVPLCILGCVGYFKVPLDMISAPAANVAIAMGIDAMIHMVHAYRRLEHTGKHHWNDWVKVRRKMWEPVMTSMFIVSAGFGIFFFSSFPPTHRFGGSIVLGTIVSAITALFIFPLLAKKQK